MPQPHSTILIVNSKSPIPIPNPNYKSKIFSPNHNPKFQSFIPIPILLPNPECQSPISITSLNSYFRSPILNPNPNLQSQIPISNLNSNPHSNLKQKINHQSQSHRCKKLKVFLAIWKSSQKLSAKGVTSDILEFLGWYTLHENQFNESKN